MINKMSVVAFLNKINRKDKEQNNSKRNRKSVQETQHTNSYKQL